MGAKMEDNESEAILSQCIQLFDGGEFHTLGKLAAGQHQKHPEDPVWLGLQAVGWARQTHPMVARRDKNNSLSAKKEERNEHMSACNKMVKIAQAYSHYRLGDFPAAARALKRAGNPTDSPLDTRFTAAQISFRTHPQEAAKLYGELLNDSQHTKLQWMVRANFAAAVAEAAAGNEWIDSRNEEWFGDILKCAAISTGLLSGAVDEKTRANLGYETLYNLSLFVFHRGDVLTALHFLRHAQRGFCPCILPQSFYHLFKLVAVYKPLFFLVQNPGSNLAVRTTWLTARKSTFRCI